MNFAHFHLAESWACFRVRARVGWGGGVPVSLAFLPRARPLLRYGFEVQSTVFGALRNSPTKILVLACQKGLEARVELLWRCFLSGEEGPQYVIASCRFRALDSPKGIPHSLHQFKGTATQLTFYPFP